MKKLKNIRITNRVKLIALSFSLIATIVNVSLVGVYLIDKMAKHSNNKDVVFEIAKEEANLNNAKSDFFIYDIKDTVFFETKNSSNLESSKTSLQKINEALNKLKTNSLIEDEEIIKKLEELSKNYTLYSNSFSELTNEQLKLGYNNYGSIGELRNSIHNIENIFKSQATSKDLEISLLKLRRHEKDFMIRRDEASLNKFNTEFSNLITLIDATLKEDNKQSIKNSLNVYQTKFNDICNSTFAIYGKGSDKGLLGKIEEVDIQISGLLADTLGLIHENTDSAQTFYTIFFIIFAFTGILVAVIMAYFVVKHINNAFNSTKVIIRQIAQGDLSVDLTVFKDDEFGDIAKELDIMNNGLKAKSEFSAHIGKGELDAILVPVSEKDQLGISLLEMQENLQHAAQEEEKRKHEDEIRNWATEGSAVFAEILRHNNDNIELLSFNVISKLVDYIGMNQGGLFIYNDNDSHHPYLEMTACYAFNRQKFTHKSIEIGEGLVGACYQEGQTIYLTDVPQNYINITSGLGNANPKCLLIVPLKLNNKIYGIIELASFNKLEKHEIEFVERIAESIASTISTVKVNIRTAQLLEISQQQAEEMRAQEEEMRQNMEEMHATQEEMGRKESKMQEMVQQMTVQEQELKNTLSEMVEKEKYTQDLIETMKQQEEELRQNMEEIHATQEELSRKDLIQQQEIARLQAENESILEKTLAKEFEYQKQIEDLKNQLSGNMTSSMIASDDKLMEWSDAIFGVDIKLIDDQHKTLLKLINELYAAFRKGQARDKMTDIINELVNYTSYHFGVEEKYFAEFNYADTPAHIEQHIKFVDTINKFKEDFTGGKAAVSFEVLNFLKDWLIKHIQGTDRAYVDCFKEHGIK